MNPIDGTSNSLDGVQNPGAAAFWVGTGATRVQADSFWGGAGVQSPGVETSGGVLAAAECAPGGSESGSGGIGLRAGWLRPAMRAGDDAAGVGPDAGGMCL